MTGNFRRNEQDADTTAGVRGSFAKGLIADHAAVAAAFTGVIERQTEGHSCDDNCTRAVISISSAPASTHQRPGCTK